PLAIGAVQSILFMLPPTNIQEWSKAHYSALTLLAVFLVVAFLAAVYAHDKHSTEAPDLPKARQTVLNWFRNHRIVGWLESRDSFQTRHPLEVQLERWAHNPYVRQSTRAQMVDRSEHISTDAEIEQVAAALSTMVIVGA